MSGAGRDQAGRAPAGASGNGSALAAWADALRLRQWHKNLVVAVPLVFAFRLFDPGAFVAVAALTAAFCLASSGTYLLNDWRDLESDCRHPLKSRRAVASGAIPRSAALAAGILLALLGLAGSAWLVPSAAGGLAAYLVLQFLYNTVLRAAPAADVIVIALGFVLRAVSGAVAIDVPFSEWLLICTFFGAVRLAIGKRQAELMAGRTGLRRGWEESRDEDVRVMGGIVSAVLVVAYTQWCFASRTAAALVDVGTAVTLFPPLSLTIPVVLFGVLRYEMIAARGRAGEPEAILVQDRQLLAASAGWVFLSVVALYAGRMAVAVR